MQDKNGTKISRGTRVMVRFEDHGPEHMPFEWTGVVQGASKLEGRIRVKSEYVSWRSPIHVEPENVERLADQAGPIVYREHRERGRFHVALLRPTADDFDFFRRVAPTGGVEYLPA